MFIILELILLMEQYILQTGFVKLMKKIGVV